MALGVLSIVPFGAAQEPQCAFLCCPAALAGISMLLSCLSIPFGVPFGVQQGPWCTLDGARMPWCVFQGVFQCGPVTLTRPSKQHSCLGGGPFSTAQVSWWDFWHSPGASVGLWVYPRSLSVSVRATHSPEGAFQCGPGPWMYLSVSLRAFGVPFHMVQLPLCAIQHGPVVSVDLLAKAR